MSSKDKLHIIFWFAASIIFSRILVLILENAGIILSAEPHIGSFRIHHITLGVILMIVAGYIALAGHLSKRGRKLDLALYGISLGLIADEFLLALKTQSADLQSYPGEYFSLINTIPALIVLGILLFLASAKKKK